MRSKPLILIVDDEENFREIFSIKLQAAGYETATAKNEAEAIAKAKELMPDLILMDIFMPPGPTGTDIALNIHQNPETRGLKIAFLTNLKDPWPAVSGDHKNISKELGMEDFLEKTDDLGNIAERVREILAKNNVEPAQSSAEPAPEVAVSSKVETSPEVAREPAPEVSPSNTQNPQN